MADLVGIINYGMGNIKSVQNALEHIGEAVRLVETPDDFAACSHLVLPGVGAYSEAMKNIESSGLGTEIRTSVKAGKPLLGICLGMQLLSDEGNEGVLTKGLGIIPGRVVRLRGPLHIPHVGWNNITLRCGHPIFEGVRKAIDFYFVHSYYFDADVTANIVATVDYGADVPCAVSNGASAVGVQFHPEKSQDNGLKILENFCAWDGRISC